MSVPDSYTTHLETLVDTTISSWHTFTTQDFISKAIKLSDKQQCRPTETPSWARKTPLFSHWSPIVKGRKATHLGRTLSASIATRRGHFTHDYHGPSGAKEGQLPPRGHSAKVNNNAANTATSMWRMTLGLQFLLNPHLSSPLTPHCHPHMMKQTPTSRRCLRVLVTSMSHKNPQH